MTDDDLRQRLLHLQDLLAQLGEPIWWMKLDLKRFFGDGKVRALGGRIGHAYLWLLARMWENDGFISSKDRVVARLLDLDVDVYRRSYKAPISAMLQRLPDTHFGEIFTQKTLVEMMIEAADLRLRNRAKTAAAISARKSTKSKQRASVTNTVTEQRDSPSDSPRHGTAPETVTSSSKSNSRDKALPQVAESLIPTAPSSPAVGALPPRANGHAEAAADVGSPGHEGRSPPQPDEPVQPTPALLNSKLVKQPKPTGLMAALWQEVEDDDGEAEAQG